MVLNTLINPFFIKFNFTESLHTNMHLKSMEYIKGSRLGLSIIVSIDNREDCDILEQPSYSIHNYVGWISMWVLLGRKDAIQGDLLSSW